MTLANMQSRIALSGRTGSGKSTTAQYLSDKHGYTVISIGTAVRSVAREFYDSDDKGLLDRLTEALTSVDPAVWRTYARTKADALATPVVLDSVRFEEDAQALQTAGFQVWRLECSSETQVRRLRASRGQAPTQEQLDSRVETELDDYAFDRVLANDIDNLDQLHAEIDASL